MAGKRIPVATVPSVAASDDSPRQVTRSFRRLLDDGYRLQVDGTARDDPLSLLRLGYTPKYETELFGARFFLCNQRDVGGLKALPAYMLPAPRDGRRARRIHARVFYKDVSLVWRAGSHYIDTDDEDWIGKGAVKWVDKRGVRQWYSAEETTNLPYELQTALDDVSRRGPRSQPDRRILSLVLRNAPADRVWPYRDFEGPRETAMRVAANRINDNRPIAWFTDDNDPTTLQFEPGYEPDFGALIDTSELRSTMYGGAVGKFRIASANGRVQYLFVAAAHHVWIVHPQAMTTELSSFGVRTVDVNCDEELCIPGYEFVDSDGSGDIDDQIPVGFIGEPCPLDPDRADASPWNEALPVVQAFRRSGLADRFFA